MRVEAAELHEEDLALGAGRGARLDHLRDLEQADSRCWLSRGANSGATVEFALARIGLTVDDRFSACVPMRCAVDQRVGGALPEHLPDGGEARVVGGARA